MSAAHPNKDRERFNQWAETYDRSLMQWLFFERVHRGVLRRLPRSFNPTGIADIGCGTGRLLRRMHTRWPQAALLGVDPSDGMVSQAQLLTPFATFHQASAEQLPVEDDSIDLVTSTISFHHWNDQAQGIREISRVLRSGGLFTLADVNISHGHPLSRAQLRSLFVGSNLSIYSQTNLVPFLAITIGKKS